MQFRQLAVLALGHLALATPVDLEKQTLDDRAVCGGTHTTRTEKVGNGNPHQNFIFKQVSGTTDCTNNPGGAASITRGQTVSWTASLGFTDSFINGGFSVSESTSTGSSNGFGCTTNKGHHKGNLCVFERIQVTAFTAEVNDCYTSDCPGAKNFCTVKKGVIFAPNSKQGSCFYSNFQLNLPCKAKGSEHHVNSGPAGGPHFIGCEPSHV